jgi:hypothetical protein
LNSVETPAHGEFAQVSLSDTEASCFFPVSSVSPCRPPLFFFSVFFMSIINYFI